MELSRNVQSENTQNLGWADIMQRDERAAWKFLLKVTEITSDYTIIYK